LKFPWLAAAVLWLGASTVQGQQSPELRIEGADGEVSQAGISLARGYAAVGVELFEELGWTVVEQGDLVVVSVPNEITVRLRLGTPFFTWDGIVLQLADAPYRDGSRAFVPLQLLSDFLPRRLPDLYEFDGNGLSLRAGDPTPGDEVQADAATEELMKASQKIGEMMYQQQAETDEDGVEVKEAGAEGSEEGDVVDAKVVEEDKEEVKDEEKKDENEGGKEEEKKEEEK